MNILKEYILKAIEKLFYIAISWKNIVFISIFITSTWLLYIDKLDGSNYTTILGIITPTVLVSREYSKRKFREIIENYKD